MISPKMARFLRKNWLLVSVTVVVFAGVGWFGVQILLDFLYFNDPRNVDVALKGWMTPRYVVLTYDLPRSLVRDILELPPDGPGGLRLGRIADNMGLTMEELTARVREAAAQYRAETQ